MKEERTEERQNFVFEVFQVAQGRVILILIANHKVDPFVIRLRKTLKSSGDTTIL